MKVILLQNVRNIGKKGDVRDVSDGYARNFLLQRKMAEPATPAGIRQVEKMKQAMAQVEQADLEKTEAMAEQLEGREIVLQAKDKDGKLFGSITAKHISRELKKENFDIPEKFVVLSEPIKETGEYDVKLEMDHGIEAVLKVIIEGEA